MAASHKPIVWGLFAGGGTVAAFILPALMFATGLAVPLGLMAPEALAYDRAMVVFDHPLGKLSLLAVIFLPLWHAAHRLRITAHDFGLRADGLVATLCYGLATLGTVATIFTLFT